MDYKILLLSLFLLILWYFSKRNLIQENKYSLIKKQGNNVKKIFKKPPKVSIKEQVKINNNSGCSPKILEHGNNYIVMEKSDITLRDMFYYFKLDKSKIEKLIKLFRKLEKYKYQHNDLNWRNIMWNNSLNDFQVIDWEFATPRLEVHPKIEDDLEFLRYNVYEIADNLDDNIIELGCKMLENIYYEKGKIKNNKGLWLLLNY
jgi:predicted Ser/Thr protein kinase